MGSGESIEELLEGCRLLIRAGADHVKKRRWYEAEADYRSASSLFDLRPEALEIYEGSESLACRTFCNLSLCLLRQQRAPDALEAARRALLARKDDSNCSPFIRSCDALLVMNELDKAENILKLLRQKIPHDIRTKTLDSQLSVRKRSQRVSSDYSRFEGLEIQDESEITEELSTSNIEFTSPAAEAQLSQLFGKTPHVLKLDNLRIKIPPCSKVPNVKRQKGFLIWLYYSTMNEKRRLGQNRQLQFADWDSLQKSFFQFLDFSQLSLLSDLGPVHEAIKMISNTTGLNFSSLEEESKKKEVVIDPDLLDERGMIVGGLRGLTDEHNIVFPATIRISIAVGIQNNTVGPLYGGSRPELGWEVEAPDESVIIAQFPLSGLINKTKEIDISNLFSETLDKCLSVFVELLNTDGVIIFPKRRRTARCFNFENLESCIRFSLRTGLTPGRVRTRTRFQRPFPLGKAAGFCHSDGFHLISAAIAEAQGEFNTCLPLEMAVLLSKKRIREKRCHYLHPHKEVPTINELSTAVDTIMASFPSRDVKTFTADGKVINSGATNFVSTACLQNINTRCIAGESPLAKYGLALWQIEPLALLFTGPSVKDPKWKSPIQTKAIGRILRYDFQRIKPSEPSLWVSEDREKLNEPRETARFEIGCDGLKGNCDFPKEAELFENEIGRVLQLSVEFRYKDFVFEAADKLLVGLESDAKGIKLDGLSSTIDGNKIVHGGDLLTATIALQEEWAMAVAYGGTEEIAAAISWISSDHYALGGASMTSRWDLTEILLESIYAAVAVSRN